MFDNKDQVKPDTIVEVWKGGTTNWGRTVRAITQSGLRTILAAPWYLNYIR